MTKRKRQDTTSSKPEYMEAAKLTREKVAIHEMINFDKTPKSPVKVSIVVPVCNVEQYLRECLDSCINQTLQDIEIICVNDGSTDNSLEILKEYALLDNRVKVIDKDNAGYGHAMNIGMDMAVGEYIGIVESDDFVELNMFDELYNLAQSMKLDIIKGDYYKIWGNKDNRKKIYTKLNKKAHCYNNIINPQNCVDIFEFNTTWSGIYKKVFLQDNNIRHLETPGASYQDIGFWFKTTCSASSIYYINKAYYYYRQDNINSSIHRKDKVYFGSNEYKKIYEYISARPELFDNYIGIYHVRKYFNFIYTLNRIDDEFKSEFVDHFSDEFKEAFEKNEINPKLYSEADFRVLQEIVETPERYKRKLFSIPTVFSTDNNYAPYLCVAVSSLVKNFSVERDLLVVIFYDNDNLNEYWKNAFKSFEDGNVMVDLININQYVNNQLLYETRHFSKAMYYRLLIPRVLNMHKKVIYLDCDIYVNHDISELYDIDLDNNVLGVTHNYCNEPTRRYVNNTLKIDADNYFNSGILVFNCEKFMSEHIVDKCFDELKKHKSLNFPDQDILNLVCKNMVLFYDYNWNFQWHHLWGDSINMPIYKDYRDIYFQAAKEPYIIHYTSHIKPWMCANRPFADLFWKAAKENIYAADILDWIKAGDEEPEESEADIKVSVIIPVYNGAEFIKECLDSVAAQTLEDIEIICIDDGSEDDTLDIIRSFEKRDKRLIVLTQEHLGGGAARNKGLEIARGEYLSFLDGDDFFEKDMLESIYEKCRKTNADIGVYKVKRYNNTTKSIFSDKGSFVEANIPNMPQIDVFSSWDIRNNIFNTFQTWTWNKLFKHSFIKKEKLRFQELMRTNDLLFVNTALLKAKRITTLPKELVYYRVGTATNCQATNSLYPFDFFNALKELKAVIKSLDNEIIISEYQKSFEKLVPKSCIYNLNSLKDADAFAKLYNFLHDEGFNEENIDILSFNKSNFDSSNKYDYNECINILNKSFEEYMYSKLTYYRSHSEELNKEIKTLKDSLAKKTKEIDKLQDMKKMSDKISVLEKKVQQLNSNNQTDYYKTELLLVKSSFSFRLGSFFTWLPRKIRRLFDGK